MRFLMMTILILALLSSGCWDTVDVDLSGLDEETLGFFGVPEDPASMYLYILAKYSEYGLPDAASGWPVNGPLDLSRRSPEGDVEWVWFDSVRVRVRFKELLDMSVSPMTPQVPRGELTISDLYVCDVGDYYCVEFEVDGLECYGLIYYGRVVFYRVDVLILFDDGCHFLYGGCPVMDLYGRRALWFVGWIEKEKAHRLMGRRRSAILKVVFTDFLTRKQREAVCRFNL